jgi:hypothetical protein
VNRDPAIESRSAVAAAVLWMLSLLATVIAEVMGVLFRGYMLWFGETDLLKLLGGAMLFIALLAGMVTLAMTPIVLQLSRTKPPRVLVVFAGMAGILPIMAVVMQMIARQ